jgi:hypothetical protein
VGIRVVRSVILGLNGVENRARRAYVVFRLEYIPHKLPLYPMEIAIIES